MYVVSVGLLGQDQTHCTGLQLIRAQWGRLYTGISHYIPVYGCIPVYPSILCHTNLYHMQLHTQSSIHSVLIFGLMHVTWHIPPNWSLSILGNTSGKNKFFSCLNYLSPLPISGNLYLFFERQKQCFDRKKADDDNDGCNGNYDGNFDNNDDKNYQKIYKCKEF